MTTTHSQSFAGRAVLITGATGPLGAAIARAMASRGATLALHDGGDAEAAAGLAAALPGATVVPADMGDPLSVQRMVDEAHRRLGRLDVLVTAHAGAASGLLLAVTPEAWQTAFAHNVHGTFFVIQAAARHMLLDRRGRIVNVLGVASGAPARGQLAHAATDGAVSALTRALASELAGKQITVNAVAPGALEGPSPDRLGLPEPERLLSRLPLGRLGTAAEVAEMVVFLASDAASYVTGETFYVDGGLAAAVRP